MSTASEKKPTELGAAPLNFIYACSLCGASFADVYEGHNETVRGLSDGINPKERLVTRLFLSNCCHVFCSSHLEGGGPPFHSEKERPKAPCPVCIKEKGEREPHFLYSIRGFNKNEYDPLIPPSWFTAPPIRLDGSGKDMDALRFQYIALIRYCQNSYASRKPLQQALKKSETKIADMETRASQEHAKLLSLQQENERLQIQKDQFEAMKAEVQRLQALEQEVEQFRNLNVNPRDLNTFITNKAAIRHYLKLVPMLMDQNEKMRKRLAQLGFAMPLEPIPNFKGVSPSAFDSDEALPDKDNRDSGGTLRKTASSHTVGRSAHASGRMGTTSSSPYARRPIKRQRLDSPLIEDMQIDRSPGRRAMQPPSKPVSRMRSVRKIFPNLRKKFSSDRSTPAVENIPGDKGDIAMYDEYQWQNVDATRQQIHTGFRSETPYMSGALPTERTSRVPAQRSPQLLASIGINKNQSDFTFRASSPVKSYSQSHEHRPTQLPTEPSYIRLMDGLTRDNGVELGLKDPRDNSNSSYPDDGRNNQASQLYENDRSLLGADRQERWKLGQPSMHQSPYRSSNAVDVFQQPSQSGTAKMYTSKNYNLSSAGRVTPQPKRHPRPGHQIENVVSPYFRSGHSTTQVYSPPGLAEPQDSLGRSGVYRSQRSKMDSHQIAWPEPRSLNGLSFFDSPVGSGDKFANSTERRKLVELEPVSSRYHEKHDLGSYGFIRRPGIGQLPHANDSPYACPKTQSSHIRQAPEYIRPAAYQSSLNHSTYNRIGEVPSTAPLVISNRSSTRTQPQWRNLQPAGVRSSQNAFDSFTGNTFGASSRLMFPSSGRRNVRR